MAVAPSPNSKASVSAPVEKVSKRKMVSEENDTKSSSQPPKRNKNPGVRVIHGRIYDSQNGTTCHQCRQKTFAVSANCKNQARTKPCPLKYCCTCLLNRYGEKAEDVALLDEWKCPKCRGVCNCSICMKKRGHQPTGMLTQTAKAGGFSSVLDMLHVKGAQNVGHYKRVKETCASPRKLAAPAEGMMITSPKKPGKENLLDGKTDSNAEDKPKTMKRKGLEGMHDGGGVKNVSLTKINHAINEYVEKKVKLEGLNETGGSMVSSGKTNKNPSDKKKVKKLKVEGSKIVGGNVDSNATLKVDGVQQEWKDIYTSTHDGNEAEEKNIAHEGGEVVDGRCDQSADQQVQDKEYTKTKKSALNLSNNSFETTIPLPTGSELVTIAGVDLPKEDAGNALELLEFCTTFGKILDVKKGQAEAVLRDIINGRSTRRGKYSFVIQFHIHLLSVIQGELESESESDSPTLDPTHGNDSWLKALKSCIPKSQHLLEHIDCTDKKAGGYDDLDSSTKLRLLICLCNEVLGTEKVRIWIDDENAKFAEKKKEAKDKLSAAKDKEKSLKQKMQDDVAKAVIAKEGAPLTMLEHDAIVSKIKNQTAEAHAEMIACKRMVPIAWAKKLETYNKRPDAVRTEPIFRNNKGHVYWKFKGVFDKPGILLQDVGTGDHIVDRWFQFDDEQMDLVEKHINVSRLGLRKGFKNFVMQLA